MEEWKQIDGFETYSVSSFGNVRNDRTGRIMAQYSNQYGVVAVGLMNSGTQYHRSVPLLVANAFLESAFPAFDTPIHLDGDRRNNSVNNLRWRPRWFAVKYNQQFTNPYPYPIVSRLRDDATGAVCGNSWLCCLEYGLLESDLVVSVLNRTYVWPTCQQFSVVED